MWGQYEHRDDQDTEMRCGIEGIRYVDRGRGNSTHANHTKIKL